MRKPILPLWVSVALAACTADGLVPRGGYCHSLSDCQVGLVCVSERCSDDLDALVTGGPDYTSDDAGVTLLDGAVADAAMSPAADAGSDGGGRGDGGPNTMDAATGASDAGRVSEAGTSDAALDASAHDAALPVDAAQPVDAEAPPDDADNPNDAGADAALVDAS